MRNSVCCTDGFETALVDDVASKRGQLKIMSLILSLVIVLIRPRLRFDGVWWKGDVPSKFAPP